LKKNGRAAIGIGKVAYSLPKKRTLRISVIVCTFNRCESLRQTIDSLALMSVPADLEWELIVVDNNSNDDTAKLVRQLQRNGSLPIRYVFEKRQGLGFARNQGISAAKGEILAFTDDDCIVDAKWLCSIRREFLADPNLGGLGGKIELYNPKDKPTTIRPFTDRIQFSSAQLFYLVAGCNMIFRREVFDIVGKFDPDFTGCAGLVADDTDFIYRVHRQGFKIIYSPEVIVFHNHGRRTHEQIRELHKGYLRGRGGFYCKHVLAGDRHVLKMAYWEITPLLKGCLKKVCFLQSPKEEASVIAHLATGAAREFMNRCRSLSR
jgi:GT2 family glycosyltransferase